MPCNTSKSKVPFNTSNFQVWDQNALFWYFWAAISKIFVISKVSTLEFVKMLGFQKNIYIVEFGIKNAVLQYF